LNPIALSNTEPKPLGLETRNLV